MFKQETTRFLSFFLCLHFYGTFCGAFNTVGNKRSRQLHYNLKWLPSGSIVGRLEAPIPINSMPSDEMGEDRQTNTHTYVEGGIYEDQFAEIEAMGGDPFFLDDDESEVKMATKESAVLPEKLDSGTFPKKDKRSVTDGKGPSPRTEKKNEHVSDSDWEWDGTVDEEAHLGWD